jgi:hypothetical protein
MRVNFAMARDRYIGDSGLHKDFLSSRPCPILDWGLTAEEEIQAGVR